MFLHSNVCRMGASQDNVMSILIKPQDGCCRVRFLAAARDFSLVTVTCVRCAVLFATAVTHNTAHSTHITV